MAFEQPYAGTADWQFPSPFTTPTNASFNNVLETPKHATSPSHFQDAFRTPQTATFATPLPHQSVTYTPSLQAPQSASPAFFNGAIGMPTRGHTPQMRPQIDPSLSNSGTIGHAGFVEHQTAPGVLPSSFTSSQMQTPPPTRGMSAKKLQQPTQIAFGTPSTIASRRFMTPHQHAANVGHPMAQHTPVQVPQLQFSPDVQQFGNFGPVSAPVMPQTQLLWDQLANTPTAPAHPILDDPFAPTLHQGPAWLAASPQASQGPLMSFDTPAMTSFSVQPPHPRPASVAAIPGHDAFSVETSQGSLDPSLIYSSPARPILRSNSRAGRNKLLQPSATIRKDSVKTPEEAPTFESVAMNKSRVSSAARPMTAHTPSAAPDGLARTAHQEPRSSSPLKRISRTPLGAISEHKPRKRASVVLTIDENGIARTERTGEQDSPTKSIRQRYPGLFDSDSSDDESDTSEHTLGGDASFSLPRGHEKRMKVARLDPPVENLEGLSIPRSSSSASMRGVTPSRAAIAAAASLRRQGSVRRRSSRNSATKRNSMTGSSSSLIDSCPMGDDDDLALDPELEPIITPRGKSRPLTSGPRSAHKPLQSALDAHNRRWSMMSFEQLHNQPTLSAATQAIHPGSSLRSHGRHSHPIRCLCGITDDFGTPLVQCSSCTQWLHTSCVGINSQQADSSPYICFLCTKPASGLR